MIGQWIVSAIIGLSDAAKSSPFYATIFALIFTLGAVITAILRFRQSTPESQKSGPVFVAAAFLVLLFCCLWASVDWILGLLDKPYLSEHIIRLLLPDGFERIPLLSRYLSGSIKLSPPASLTIGVAIATLFHFVLSLVLKGTLDEMIAINERPDDSLTEEELEAKKNKTYKLPNNKLGRLFRFFGHWKDNFYVEDRYRKWQLRLSLLFGSFSAFAALPTLTGQLSPAVTVGCLLFSMAIGLNLRVERTKQEEVEAPVQTKEIASTDPKVHEHPNVRPFVKRFAHSRSLPAASSTTKKPNSVAARCGIELEEHEHQLLNAIAERSIAVTSLDTRPRAFYAAALCENLADFSSVIFLVHDALQCRAAMVDFLEIAKTGHWGWNVSAADLANAPGKVDLASREPSVMFTTPAALARHYVGESWETFISHVKLVVVFDADAFSGVEATEIRHLISMVSLREDCRFLFGSAPGFSVADFATELTGKQVTSHASVSGGTSADVFVFDGERPFLTLSEAAAECKEDIDISLLNPMNIAKAAWGASQVGKTTFLIPELLGPAMEVYQGEILQGHVGLGTDMVSEKQLVYRLRQGEQDLESLKKEFAGELLAKYKDQVNKKHCRKLDIAEAEVSSVEQWSLSNDKDNSELLEVIDVTSKEIVATLQKTRANNAYYPGRVFSHNKRSYAVVEEQNSPGRIQVAPAKSSLVTSPIRRFEIVVQEQRTDSARQNTETEAGTAFGGSPVIFQTRRLQVTEQGLGYRTFSRDGAVQGTHHYSESIESHYTTSGKLLAFPDAYGPMSGQTLHALVNAMSYSVGFFLKHDETDIEITSGHFFGNGMPVLAFLDLHPGGAGFARAIDHALVSKLIRRSLIVLNQYPEISNGAESHSTSKMFGKADFSSAISVLQTLVGELV